MVTVFIQSLLGLTMLMRQGCCAATASGLQNMVVFLLVSELACLKQSGNSLLSKNNLYSDIKEA